MTAAEAPKQSLLSRLLRHPFRSGAVHAIETLVRDRVLVVSRKEIVAQYDKFHLPASVRREIDFLLYKNALEQTVADENITNAQAETLETVRRFSGLSTADVETFWESIVFDRYRRAFAAAASNGRISSDQWTALDRLAIGLRLPKEKRAAFEVKERRKVISARIDEIMDRGWFDPPSAIELTALMSALGASEADIAPEQRAELEHLAMIWRLGYEALPDLPVPIALQKNEICHLMCSAIWMEMRTTTRVSGYGGPVLRVPVIRGLSFRLAAYKHTSIQTNQLTVIDHGPLYVTSKRIIFGGERKNSTIRLSGILNVTPHDNGVVIDKSSGKSPHLQLFGADSLEFATILRRVVAESNM